MKFPPILLLFTLLLLAPIVVSAQEGIGGRPKLVVGIIVDQMRQEFLYRFYDQYGEDGFKRLIGDGFFIRNGHYNYIPTYTGPGHASVYTGTTPRDHGIISNDWYDKKEDRMVNCVEDKTVQTLGEENVSGQYSPVRLLSSTITDELRLSTQMEARVIGISIKNRGAILPAGRAANGAYWYDGGTGKFVSSTYYGKKLPGWVQKFNALKWADEYLSKQWKTLNPIEAYTASQPDDRSYEGKMSGKKTSVFPYNLAGMRDTIGYNLLTLTPFGNSIVVEMAKAAIRGEKLGEDEVTDFLALSFSSTDIIGHAFGPYSVEIQDTYLRLDEDIAAFMKHLDDKVGAGNYLMFLTADHAVVPIPQYLMDSKLAAGYLNEAAFKSRLQGYASVVFGQQPWIKNLSNNQVFLDKKVLMENKVNPNDVALSLVDYGLSSMGIAHGYTASEMRNGNFNAGGIRGKLIRGYHPKRSGDVVMSLEPFWLPASRIGTSHGSGYTYDTHVPIIFYGWNIKSGQSVRPYSITDIAPTLSMLLNITLPNSATGQPIAELFE